MWLNRIRFFSSLNVSNSVEQSIKFGRSTTVLGRKALFDKFSQICELKKWKSTEMSYLKMNHPWKFTQQKKSKYNKIYDLQKQQKMTLIELWKKIIKNSANTHFNNPFHQALKQFSSLLVLIPFSKPFSEWLFKSCHFPLKKYPLISFKNIILKAFSYNMTWCK